MSRRTQKRGGSKSKSRKSRSSPKGVPMPEYQVKSILDMEKESDSILWPDMSAEQKANNNEHRKLVLENLRFPRGTNTWSHMTSVVSAYHGSLNGKN
jgi:hypothetical protein